MAERTILVTGAGRGAGQGIATELAKAGGNVATCDLDKDTCDATAKTVEANGANVLSLQCDVSDENAVDAMFAAAVERFGPIDVLANTVAWIDPPGPISELPTERWHKAIRTNLDSVMFCTRAVLR